ncbi:putative non-LTR retroelement reverse transcriptase [Cucumis melo var. makuwa]|uniref:Putative non-LTR retroelement reverse transcriptase n=1 Tax=Cucumis melo var. makuwa TaxID=1194695 RepID=A0A5D3DSA8_CUCMM|nr:putative non-LTR retroelement reverse transcriptase [Cucumis melo var. makuwa]
MRNLHNLKPALRRCFGRHIQRLSEEVRIAKEGMDRAQREVERNPMSDVLSRQAGLATESFWTAVRLEEASLRQKSRIQWLNLGDQNTAFFHRSVRSRMSRNSLLSLVDSDGSRVAHDGVLSWQLIIFVTVWDLRFGYRELTPVIDDIVQFRWPEKCCQALQLPISRDEVRRVLFSMDNGKAPGPDGFSLGFFKGTWTVVGEDFCDAVLHFFETCYLPSGVNATAITLIPKRSGAERMEDFRPISCCNVLYKCISKILADRLRVWLPSFISSNQSAFIPGRSIIENILLCQELFGLLIAIGTPLKKGVRQGDPLSPFLFVMMMEVLSCMLNKIPQSFLFHHRCEKVKLNHLTFADDLMIFCAADESSLRLLLIWLLVWVVLGNLPVRYLGLPLLSGRLRSSDCAPLIQRITSRIRSWFAQVLSFAGRLQLIRSVLRSLQVFWASVFVLPTYVHNKVDKILRSYLWRDKEEGRGGVKVAWVEVEAYILKGRSLWEVDSRVGRSWCLRAILRKREKLKHQVRMEVRHGSTCRVWLDPWLQGGPILEQEVSPCISVRDRWVWVLGRQGGFSIASAWEVIRPRGGRVRWTGLLWGGGSISIPFVCGWPLKISWTLEIDYIGGIAQYRCRVFSVRGVWSLAITCSFRVRMGDVWSRVLRIMASSHRIGHWGVELSWICHRGIGKGVRRKLWRVLWCATIYFIWNERNHRLHGGQARDPIVIFHLICTWIRARAGSWREDANLPF